MLLYLLRSGQYFWITQKGELVRTLLRQLIRIATLASSRYVPVNGYDSQYNHFHGAVQRDPLSPRSTLTLTLQITIIKDAWRHVLTYAIHVRKNVRDRAQVDDLEAT